MRGFARPVLASLFLIVVLEGGRYWAVRLTASESAGSTGDENRKDYVSVSWLAHGHDTWR